MGPYLQAMHFAFGVGAFVSPIIVGEVSDNMDGDPTWYVFFQSLKSMMALE